ncbi:fimbrial protein [Pseudomonas putida]|uniref:Type 1 fimbrial protein n=1 Tax=Pseudomonas putida TaxID=303 RepID=A0A6I6XE62_PSEPU|nr:fimbrial protein [Pseudomonas putida]QHG63922.1 type 1 fimbrial protein [Pseudomonas putida]
MSTIGCLAPRPMAAVACALALGLLCGEVQARCEWTEGPANLPFLYDFDGQTLWVPRDAEIGYEIANRTFVITNRNNSQMECFNEPPLPTTISMPASTAIAVGVPVRGQRPSESVLRTNVDGIGAIISLGFPFDGSSSNTFTSDDATQTIPYNGSMRGSTGFAAPLKQLFGRVRLVKTGPIATGDQFVDKEMFRGATNDKGKVMDFTLQARVKQAQCTLLANPVSEDPVTFDDRELADFTGPGPITSSEKDFSIRLSDCDDHSTAPTAYAHIELQGTKGSMALDAKRGIFSLGTGSTAAGFGIQILHGDGRELPLEEAVSVKRLQLPVTQLEFKARYYQLDPTVTPGLAKAALSFTVSYR